MHLSIDTSTRYASVALSSNGETIIELSWRSQRNHSVELIPAIKQLLESQNVKASSLSAIFIAKGPGAFSALRVGMSTAKSMSDSLSIPLVDINTLDIESFPYTGTYDRVCAIIPAGRTRVYVGKYQRTQDPSYEVIDLEEFIAQANLGWMYCGEAVSDLSEKLRNKLGDDIKLSQVPQPTRTASKLAFLATKYFEKDMFSEALTLEPFYLRSSQVDSAYNKRAKTS